MQRVESLPGGAEILRDLIACKTNGTVRRADDCHAQIKSFQAVFKNLQKTPELLRLLLQNEFNFEGMINAFSVKMASQCDSLLKEPWFKSTFVVPHYSNVKQWLQKCIAERAKGNIIAILLPARTNTHWFTDLVINSADEVRFVEGRMTMPGFKTQSPFPDCIAIFAPAPDGTIKPAKQTRSGAGVGIITGSIACKTSFTDDKTEFLENEDEESEQEDDHDLTE